MMWMAGYASRTKPAEGVALDLFAKALALEDPAGKRLIILTLDLIGIPRTLRINVAVRLQKEQGIDPACLMMNASHTHCGPELRVTSTELTDEPNRRAAEATAYTEKLENTLVALASDALKHLQPASLRYSFARCGFAMNRRTPGAKGYANHPYPQGPVDHQVPVLKVTGADGKEIAIAFGYNCHNTTMSFMQFCGDYAGYAQLDLEQEHPGAVALFINGCSGDQNPYPRGKIEQVQTHGRSLASAVDAALETDLIALTGPLRAAYQEIPLAYSPVPSAAELETRQKSTSALETAYAGRLMTLLKQRGSLPSDYPYPVQVIRLGDQLTLVALGGETVVDYSLRLKSEAKDAAVWVAGYSNDVMTYIPSLRVLKEGGYEAGDAMKYGSHPAPWSDKVEEQILSTVHRLRKTLE